MMAEQLAPMDTTKPGTGKMCGPGSAKKLGWRPASCQPQTTPNASHLVTTCTLPITLEPALGFRHLNPPKQLVFMFPTHGSLHSYPFMHFTARYPFPIILAGASPFHPLAPIRTRDPGQGVVKGLRLLLGNEKSQQQPTNLSCLSSTWTV